MIYHFNRAKLKTDATREQIEEVLESMRNHGRMAPSVKSFVVGRDHGGDFDWAAMFVIDDLDGLWEYLTHPAVEQSDRIALPLVERLDVFDICDDDDPEMSAKIDQLHQRRNELKPGVSRLVADLPTYVGPAAEDTKG